MFPILFINCLYISNNCGTFVSDLFETIENSIIKMGRKFYVISYDLKMPGRDYTSLYDAIKSYKEWRHPLESTWIVFTSGTANDISEKLRSDGKMDNSDLLFVCALDIDDRQGWLDKFTWEWIRNCSK